MSYLDSSDKHLAMMISLATKWIIGLVILLAAFIIAGIWIDWRWLPTSLIIVMILAIFIETLLKMQKEQDRRRH